MSKATEIDTLIAGNVRAARLMNGLTQPQVAAYLGIAYQSYQKMEKEGHAFRVSTLSRLAAIYGVGVDSFTNGTGFGVVKPAVVKATVLLNGLNEAQQNAAVEHILGIRYGLKGKAK